MSIKMYGNLTANQLVSGGRLLLSVELKTKIVQYCATHQISAHALPRDAEELVDFMRFMDWDDATTDPNLMDALGTKLLAFLRNNITPEKLRPGLIETQDPTTKTWTATWKNFTLAWANDGGFVWGKTMNELDLETMAPVLKEVREPEMRPYIAPAALVRQAVEFVDSDEYDDVVEASEEEMTEVEVMEEQLPRFGPRVQQASRGQEQQATQQADNAFQQQRAAEAAEALCVEAERVEAQRVANEQMAQHLAAQSAEAEAKRVEAERVETQRIANEQVAQHLAAQAAEAEAKRVEAERVETQRIANEQMAQHLAAQAAEAEAKRVESERIASQRLSQNFAAQATEAKRIEDQRNADIAAEAKRVEAQRVANEQMAQELANQAAEAELNTQRLQEMQSSILALRDQMAAADALNRLASKPQQCSVSGPNHYSANDLPQVAEITLPEPTPKFVLPTKKKVTGEDSGKDSTMQPTFVLPASNKKVTGKDNTIQTKTGTTIQERAYQDILADTLARSAPSQPKAAALAVPYDSILASVLARGGNKAPTNWAPVVPQASTYQKVQANVAASAAATKPNTPTNTSKPKTSNEASYESILAKVLAGPAGAAQAGPSIAPKVAASMTKKSAAASPATGMGGLRRSARVKAVAASR